MVDAMFDAMVDALFWCNGWCNGWGVPSARKVRSSEVQTPTVAGLWVYMRHKAFRSAQMAAWQIAKRFMPQEKQPGRRMHVGNEGMKRNASPFVLLWRWEILANPLRITTSCLRWRTSPPQLLVSGCILVTTLAGSVIAVFYRYHRSKRFFCRKDFDFFVWRTQRAVDARRYSHSRSGCAVVMYTEARVEVKKKGVCINKGPQN